MIAGMTYYQILWYFVIYAFLGWCVEVIFHAVKVGKVINRGFLCGPVCPVYGFGVLAVFAMTKSVLPCLTGLSEMSLQNGKDPVSILTVYLAGVILATAVELLAGWLLDTAFHMRWWDYSAEPFNLHGYICLRFSLIWGMAILIVVRIVQPMMEMRNGVKLPERYGWIVLGIVYAGLAADAVVTVMMVIGLNKKLKELDEINENMHLLSDRLSYALATGTMKAQTAAGEAQVQAALAKAELRDAVSETREALEKAYNNI